MTTKSLITINNNLMCSIDLETSGLIPGYHEIIQIALLPLDSNLNPSKLFPPFDFKIKPTYLNRVNLDALKITRNQFSDIVETGFEQEVVKEIFYSWFDKLKLGESRKIVPLGHNISGFDIPFIRAWLSHETYENYFHGHLRDLQTIACYLNDRAEFHAEQTPFPKLGLKEIAAKLGVEIIKEMTHDALYDAVIASECYQKILLKLINI